MWRKPHLYILRQILVSLVLLVTSICVIDIILLQPDNPKTSENVVKTANPKTSGDIMTAINNKSSGYVMETTYWDKTAPLEFDFTFSDTAKIVKSWRNHSADMKWKIVDILKIVSAGDKASHSLHITEYVKSMDTINIIFEMFLPFKLFFRIRIVAGSVG